MPAVPLLSSTGAALDLEVRQGVTLGPHTVELLDTDGQPVILTGCTLQGSVWNRTVKVADIATEITDEIDGIIQFSLADEITATLVPSSGTGPVTYKWHLELIDTLDRVNPLYSGRLRVLRRAADT